MACIFNIEDSDLAVSGCRNHSSVVGMWHELDGEDVGGMAGRYGGGELEGGCRI